MCLDPVTMAAIAAAGSAVLGVGQSAMAYRGGKEAEQGLKEQARQETLASALEETQMRMNARRFAASQRVAALKAGGDISSGSTAAVLDADVRSMELDALMKRYGGQVKAENLRSRGRQAAKAGAIEAGFGLMRTAVDAVGAGSRGDFKGFGGGG